MRAASRETYAPAAEKLDAIARGDRADALASIGDELLAVAGLLGREPRLRRALADPARSGADRAELLDDVVGGSVERRHARGASAWSRAVAGRAPTRCSTASSCSASTRCSRAPNAPVISARSRTSCSGSARSSTAPRSSPPSWATSTVDAVQRDTLVDSLLDGKAKPVTIRLAHAGPAPGSAAGR